MASLAPPDGVVVVSGAWGTDMDRNESVFLSGNASLEFKNTTPAADPKIKFAPIPVHKGTADSAVYDCSVVVRASSVASGTYTLTIQAETYNAAGTLQATKDIHATGILTLANTWETKSAAVTISSSSHNYVVITVLKNNVAFTAYVDSVDVRRRPPCFEAVASSTPTTIASGAWTALLCTEQVKRTDFDYATGTGRATKLYTGVTTLGASAYFASGVSDGNIIGIRIVGSAGGVLASNYFAVGAGMTPQISVACTDPDNTTGYYYTEVYQNSGGNIDVTGRVSGVTTR